MAGSVLYDKSVVDLVYGSYDMGDGAKMTGAGLKAGASWVDSPWFMLAAGALIVYAVMRR